MITCLWRHLLWVQTVSRDIRYSAPACEDSVNARGLMFKRLGILTKVDVAIGRVILLGSRADVLVEIGVDGVLLVPGGGIVVAEAALSVTCQRMLNASSSG